MGKPHRTFANLVFPFVEFKLGRIRIHLAGQRDQAGEVTVKLAFLEWDDL